MAREQFAIRPLNLPVKQFKLVKWCPIFKAFLIIIKILQSYITTAHTEQPSFQNGCKTLDSQLLSLVTINQPIKSTKEYCVGWGYQWEATHMTIAVTTPPPRYNSIATRALCLWIPAF